MSDKAKEFWDQQAREHGPSDLATAPDRHYRTLEIRCILNAIGNVAKRETILDVGCGNGFSTLQIAKKFPEAMITGIDYSEAMIAEANKKIVPNVEFFVGNVLTASHHKELKGQRFDIVLSTRCLINLMSWKEQTEGLLQMLDLLEPDGRLILVENFTLGLNNLNALRNSVGLDPIKTRWHNRYLDMDELAHFSARNDITLDSGENIGNMYYIASRVIYARICKDEGVEPDYENPINEVAARLPTHGEHHGCSPNFLFVFRRIEP